MVIHEPTVSRDSVLPFDPRNLEERRRRAAAAVRLLDEWESDESNYDEETWPLLKQSLEQTRRQIGAQSLFPHE